MVMAKWLCDWCVETGKTKTLSQQVYFIQVSPFIGGSCWVSFLPIQLAWDYKALFLLFYPQISDESEQEWHQYLAR